MAMEPRLCHLVKWPDFRDYGFNLHAEKNKLGQYIGKSLISRFFSIRCRPRNRFALIDGLFKNLL